MPMLTVGGTEIEYVLKRSAVARRARIMVTPDEVEVVVPESATDEQIARALHRKRAWIFEQTRAVQAKAAKGHVIHRFATGAKIPYRGRLMKLSVVPGDDPLVGITYRNGFLVEYPRAASPASRDSLIETALRLWLQKRVREDVGEFVRRYSAEGLKPKGFQIKNQKHLWGSCGQDRVINLNWKLVFAPKAVLEYAVIHELCHLKHRNHDDVFWQLVGRLAPDWHERKLWLERNEHVLGFEKVETVIDRIGTAK